MNAFQRVLFTVLPHGRDPNVAGRYHASIYISPRLTTDGGGALLHHYADWKVWPAVVNGVKWSIVFDAGSPIPATVVSPAARSDLWTVLFKPETLVAPYAQQSFTGIKIVSYPAKHIHRFLLDLYTKTAVNHADDFPPFSIVSKSLEGLAPGTGGEIPFDNIVEGLLEQQGAITNGNPEPGIDFAQLRRFHRSRVTLPTISEQKKKTYVPLPQPTRPTLDFHRALSALGQYPPLMRLLGLVVDLTFDVAGAPPATPSLVSVVPGYTPSGQGPGEGPVIGRVRTRCLIDSGTFQAAPSSTSPELEDGRLPLGDSERYTVIQEDIDGAGLKNISLAANLNRLLTNPDHQLSPASPQHYALPSMRSGGLSVARFNLAPQLKKELDKAAGTTKDADGPTPENLLVEAEDLVRGYRIDILDGLEGRWFSLLKRQGAYKFPGGVSVPFADEGWVTQVPTEDQEQSLYMQESIFSWDGWSLAAPRPGARINTVKDPATTDAANTPDPDFPVEVDKKVVPGSLPRLRFGRIYAIRARAADLAGNSVDAPAAGGDRHMSNRLTYLRYEPVTTPPVLLHKPRTQGESLERVVLRSNYNIDPSPAQVSRHIVPPKTDQLQAEQHGLFDTDYPGSRVDAAAYPTITAYPQESEPPGPVQQSEQGNFNSDNQGEPDPTDMKKIRFFDMPLVQLPYLPDPLARGAAFYFEKIEQMPSFQMLKAPFTPDPAWPRYAPWRLVVEGYGEVPQPPFLVHDKREIHIQLAKAETAVVRLSAYVNEQDLGQLGIWNLILQNGQNIPALRFKVLNGRHWMITPYRTLTLVHAVRQPLRIADFVTEGPDRFGIQGRALADTAIRFKGRIVFDINGTSRIDLVASWDEYVDDGPRTPDPRPPGEPAHRRTIPISIPSGRGQKPNFPNHTDPDFVVLGQEQDRQEFGDTKRRDLTYTTVATTAFAEYFTQSHTETITYTGGTRIVALPDEGQGGIVAGSVKVKNLVDKDDDAPDFATYVEGTDFTVDAGKSEVTFIETGGVPGGTTVVITYLVPPIVRPWRPEVMKPVQVVVPSTAAPAPPKPVYVVPTFDWSLTRTTNQIMSSRKGRGLRVYLERPWWTSGKGELLGVVLLTGLVGTETRTSKATQWGVDPAFRSAPVTNRFPGLSFFPDADQTGTGLAVPGGLGLYDVAAFDVAFDAARDLWYSDIVVGTFSYVPFIRLALARFQPASVVGAHLSSVVVADFAQLTPDRLVTVLPGSAASRRRVNVSGASFDKQVGQTGPIIRVTVERQSQNTDLGWEAVGTTTLNRTSFSPPASSWTGEVTVLPSGTDILGSGPHVKQRLVIEEFERHGTATDPTETATADRLVFSDVIEL